MTRSAQNYWWLGVAAVSLLAAIAVYCFARISPPEIFAPFQAVHPKLASYTGILGSAPSFLYTLALCLIISACTSNRFSAVIHCISWIGFALCLEISQHPILADPVSVWLETALADSIWSLFGPYWVRGVFDPLDLVATVIGGAIGLALLTRITMENSDVQTP